MFIIIYGCTTNYLKTRETLTVSRSLGGPAIWQWFSGCFCSMRSQLKWQQWSAIFSSEGQVTNIVNSVGRTVFVATTQLCYEVAKAAMDNTCTNGCGCTPGQLYLQKQVAGWLAWGVSWPIPDPKV